LLESSPDSIEFAAGCSQINVGVGGR
jgi:hypothetical protein